MIKRFICWLWGHKFTVKAFTGQTYVDTKLSAFMGQVITGHYYKWQQEKFCLRCGKQNPHKLDFIGEDNIKNTYQKGLGK